MDLNTAMVFLFASVLLNIYLAFQVHKYRRSAARYAGFWSEWAKWTGELQRRQSGSKG